MQSAALPARKGRRIHLRKTDCESEQSAEKLEAVFPPGIRLDHFLVELTQGQHSRSTIQKLIEGNCIHLEGIVEIKPSLKLKHEAKLTAFFPHEAPAVLVPSSDGVPILFQDDYLAIVHKPAGMTVHPGSGTGDDTLVHSLLAQMQLSEGSEKDRPGIVHRLDRETEGLMLIAKTNSAHEKLAGLFSKREITKEYHALLWGKTQPEGILEGFIARHPRERKRMIFIEDEESLPNAKSASLSYQTLSQNERFSLVKVILHTGRTHQIRASFQHILHPVVGDSLYSNVDKKIRQYKAGRSTQEKIQAQGLFLVASRLAFIHPFTGKEMEFTLEIPETFSQLAE